MSPTPERDRFDALALIREFRLTSARPSLDLLAQRLEGADSPGASYELDEVNDILRRLDGQELRSEDIPERWRRRLRRDRSHRFGISVPLLAQNRLRAIVEDIDLVNAWRLARHPPCNASEVVVEPRHDAYGKLLLAALEGDDVVEIVEREDGFISPA